MSSKLSSSRKYWGKDMLSRGVLFKDVSVDNPHPVVKVVEQRMTTKEIEEILVELEQGKVAS
jgi:hypothetical protein